MIQQSHSQFFEGAHYQLAIDAAGVGLWDWNLVHNSMVWSERCKSILGLPADAPASYELFLSCLHPDDRERVDCVVQESLAHSFSCHVTYRIPRPEGHVRWVEARGQGIYDQQGRAIRMLGVVFDITAQVQAEEHQRMVEQYTRETLEEASQQSEELARQLVTKQAFLQALMEQAPSGLLIAEAPSGKLIFYNEEAFRLLGPALLEGEDYRKYTHYGAIHPDGSFYHLEEYPLTRALTDGEIVRQEFMSYRRKDGSVAYLAVNAAPIRGPLGQIIAAISAFDDISARYELEKKKDEFISIASHELRTPLTGMMGNLQMAQRRLKCLLERAKGMGEEEREGVIGDIDRRITRALSQVKVQSRMIDDLLDATRIQARKLRLSLELCNLVDIVRGVVADLRAILPCRTIVLCLPERTEMVVAVDAVRIGQVIHNFVNNALKYAPETEPVTIGIGREELCVRVWVRDAGPGLSPEEQQRIWDRFYQKPGDDRGKGLDGGDLGLGLYICQALVREHKGTIGVQSVPGEGSTFWFTLPLVVKDH
jgi:PAS domain S-box-containing protein